MELLKLIRGFCCRHDQNNNKNYAVFNILRVLFVNFHKTDDADNDYLKEFQACLATLDDYNANVVDLVPCLVEDSVNNLYGKTIDQATKEELKVTRENVLKRGLATFLLIGTDCIRYGVMKNQMQQNMAIGTNNYLKLEDETMNIINTIATTSKGGVVKKQIEKSENIIKVTFAKKNMSKVTCYLCGKKGHFCKNLPKKD